jgi:Peptidase family M1 domain
MSLPQLRSFFAAYISLAFILPFAASASAQQGSVVANSAGQSAPHAGTTPETKFEVADAARRAILFTKYALDVRLETRDATMHTRAILTVKNDSAAALDAIPLQISSSLQWEAINAGGKPLRFAHHTVATDADHTGAMNEALVTLASPLAPGGEETLTVFYSGSAAPSAKRLETIGTPPDVAIHADWDGVRDEFTGLRGFGNVLWYPVCNVPVVLGDSDRFFSEIGMTKLRERAAMVSMTVTEEFSGAAPTVAFLDGVPVTVEATPPAAGSDLPGIATAKLPETRLGFATPTLFLAHRTLETGNHLKLYARQSDAAATQSYMTAASILTSQMTDWFGAKPKSDLSILDPAEAEDNPSEERALVVTNIANVDPKKLLGPMSHVLTHAYFQSPQPWLEEGVAQFMASVWTERRDGREAAITQMDNMRGALSLAETGDPDRDAGQPLIAAHDPIFYRTKATYVFWMLRGIVGDKPLAAALEQYGTTQDAKQDQSSDDFQHLLERASNQKLDWFFNDWVNRDRGLPVLNIEAITPSKGSTENSYIIAVTVSNAGTAVADVPVTLYSTDATVTERMRIEPKGRTTRRFLVHGRPQQVQVNDGTTPETEASVHRKDIEYTGAQ